MIRQLENSIEKMLMKVHTGQKVTLLYLAVRDVLKKVGCPRNASTEHCDGHAPWLGCAPWLGSASGHLLRLA